MPLLLNHSFPTFSTPSGMATLFIIRRSWRRTPPGSDAERKIIWAESEILETEKWISSSPSKRIVLRLSHLKKAKYSMFSNVLGSVISSIPDSQKQLSPIFSSRLSSAHTTRFSFVHLQKASVPISLTLAEISTLSISLPQNQWFPIFSAPSGITTLYNALRSQTRILTTIVSGGGPTFIELFMIAYERFILHPSST